MNITQRAADAAGEALGAATDALDSSRQLAVDTARRMGEGARDLRVGAAEALLAGSDSVSEAAAAAQRQLGRFAGASRRRVAEAPMKSVLIAAAVGAAAALLLALLRSRRDQD